MNGDEPNAPVDLSLLVERVAGDASFEAENEGKRVLVGELPVDPVISGDEALLASALENVVRNALRHTAPGTAVEVDLKETGSRIVLSVRDHGPGVEEEELQRIFQPFYRSDAARDRRSGGVGLGLAIAKRAVERHGGSIRASRASGGGLLVEIVLPRETRRGEGRRA
jgi:two-component system sensor histidine kinase CpxA